jgi:DNA adenine methylase
MLVTEQTIERPPLRYFGGKWRIASWVISHFPEHKTYCEPFGGGASVLLSKPRVECEIYNDLDSEIHNFFWVLRHRTDELLDQLKNTPFGRRELLESYVANENPLEQARRTVVRSWMSFSSQASTGGRSGFRNFVTLSNGNKRSYGREWTDLPAELEKVASRLRGVMLENRNGIDVIQALNSSQVLMYVDPPYLAETRSKECRSSYRHEMSDKDHDDLLNVLTESSAMVILSGYASERYQNALKGWSRLSKQSYTQNSMGAGAREEVLWINPVCQMVLDQQNRQMGLELLIEGVS